MHRIATSAVLAAALCALTLPAFATDAPSPRGAPGEATAAPAVDAILETQAIPELGQTIVYVRFPEAVEGTGALEFVDSSGQVRASAPIEVLEGTGMTVWDGRGATGDPLPSGLWSVRLTFDGRELAAPIVR